MNKYTKFVLIPIAFLSISFVFPVFVNAEIGNGMDDADVIDNVNSGEQSNSNSASIVNDSDDNVFSNNIKVGAKSDSGSIEPLISNELDDIIENIQLNTPASLNDSENHSNDNSENISNDLDDNGNASVNPGERSNSNSDNNVNDSISNGDDDIVVDTSVNSGNRSNSATDPIINNAGDDSANQIPETSNPITTPISNNSTPNTSSSRSSGGSSSGGSRTIRLVESCKVLDKNENIVIGQINNSNSITKLQTFLKNVEKMNVDINGIFDSKTINAVKAFQLKYKADILDPWGIDKATGNVYFTTSAKINSINCNTPFTLTPEQVTSILAFKKANENVKVIVSKPIIKKEITPEVEIIEEESTTTTPIIGENNTPKNTASVSDAPESSRISRFFKWLFGN